MRIVRDARLKGFLRVPFRLAGPPPSLLDTLAELPRVLLEAQSLALNWSALVKRLPKGNGHGVLVMPGFGADDTSTFLLRELLLRLGYDALPWKLGRNTGRPELERRLLVRARQLFRLTDGKMTLIGQSLGGVFAREVARAFPDHVRQVITLGSPFGSTHATSTTPVVRRLFELLSGLKPEDLQARAYDLKTPPPVPVTAIYSKTDGIVAWRACLEQESHQTENIEVLGSHSGMAVNPSVIRIVADRLAQPEDQWRKFAPPHESLWMYPNMATQAH